MAVTVTTPRFSLSLGGDWTELASSDQDLKTFNSRSNGANLVVSSMALKATLADTARIAEQLVNIRMEAEKQVAAQTGINMSIVTPKLVPRAWGHAIAYYGWDDRGRKFQFTGMVTPKQALSVFAESNTLSEENVKVLLEQVLAKLEFDLT